MIEFLRCLWLPRFRRLEDAREAMTVASWYGVRSVAESCRRCNGFHVRSR